MAESVPELIDAMVRTEVDASDVAAAKAEIDSADRRVRAVSNSTARSACADLASGERMAWNAVVGMRNPIARR